MDSSLILQNLLSPPVLFFFLGVIAVLVGSDLEIPSPLPKLFSLYLLLAIGFKGGLELQHSGLGGQVLPTIAAAVGMSLLVPVYSFLLLKLRFDGFNAAAIAATYGSISAVTFITAEGFLETQKLPFDGFMVAALALMESPAIIVGLFLVKLASPQRRPDAKEMRWQELLREAFLNSSVLLLVGSLVIGLLVAAYSPASVAKMLPFSEQLFPAGHGHRGGPAHPRSARGGSFSGGLLHTDAPVQLLGGGSDLQGTGAGAWQCPFVCGAVCECLLHRRAGRNANDRA